MTQAVDSFREAAPLLRRPFTPAAVKFKVQANIGPKDAPTGGLIVAYIDARLVVERLNMIVPDRWSDHYEAVSANRMWCHLTVDGITRSDVGDGEGKGLVSDALKRAAVKFGVGVSLYATPTLILNVSDGHLRVKQSNKGPTCVLTPNGETHVRRLYESWLNAHGIQGFGDPLDHGDVENAQGDVDAPESEPAVTEPPRTLVSRETAAELVGLARGLTVAQIREGFAQSGLSEPQAVNATIFAHVPQDAASLLAAALSGMEREGVAA